MANANGVTYPMTRADTDIHIKEILGRGTKQGGLYYIDDFSPDMANSTPQQNGVVERTLLIGAHVPRHHWDDVIVTSVYLINHMPSGVQNFRTPLQVLAQYGPCPLFWCSHPKYWDVWSLFISTKINVASLIPTPFVVFLWDMPLIRKVVGGDTESRLGATWKKKKFAYAQKGSIVLPLKIDRHEGQEMINHPTLMINRPEPGKQCSFLLETDQSSIPDDRLPNPCEAISDLSPTPTNNPKQQAEDPLSLDSTSGPIS
ncbi:unnamed protein product [Prunus armeniaca]